MDKNYEQIKTALDFALKNLVRELRKGNHLQDHQRKLEQKKIYDRLQEKYIARERLKKELAQDYESSGSDSQAQSDFKGLTQNQLRFLMRKKLIHKNFDQNVLDEVKIYQPLEDAPCDEQIDSQVDIDNYDIDEIRQEPKQDLKVINETNELLIEELKEQKNLFALKFLIEELQKIDGLRKADKELNGKFVEV